MKFSTSVSEYITTFSAYRLSLGLYKLKLKLPFVPLLLEISKMKLILPDKTCTVQNLLYSKRMRNAHNQKGKDKKRPEVL